MKGMQRKVDSIMMLFGFIARPYFRKFFNLKKHYFDENHGEHQRNDDDYEILMSF
jgi:hypothetical protein